MGSPLILAIYVVQNAHVLVFLNVDSRVVSLRSTVDYHDQNHDFCRLLLISPI